MNPSSITTRGSLNPEQVEFYDREGYLVLPHLLNEDDTASVRQAMQQKVDMIADALLAAELFHEAPHVEKRRTGLQPRALQQFGNRENGADDHLVGRAVCGRHEESAERHGGHAEAAAKRHIDDDRAALQAAVGAQYAQARLVVP